MNLTTALGSASSALALNAAQTAIVAKNISSSGDTSYNRKVTQLETQQNGAAAVVVTRAASQPLFSAMLGATSASAASGALSSGLDQLQTIVGDTNSGTSPADLITGLDNALQTLAASPASATAGDAAITAATTLANGLNAATTTVQGVREQADQQMVSSVAAIDNLLGQFQTANAAVVTGTKTGADVTDAMDTRDGILAQLSQQIGISTVTRPSGDMAIYTDGGTTLFDGGARSVTMKASPTLAAGVPGNAVYVDGVAVTGSASTMPITSGALAGLSNLRDNAAPHYQSQLDEIARGLVQNFSESGQSSSPASPTQPGLFTYSGAPAMPGSAVLPGLAGDIKVAASADPAQGGDWTLLRDGGISQPGSSAYTYNTTGDASYTDRLQQLSTNLGSAQSFSPAAGLGSSESVEQFAADSNGWLEAARQTATNASASQQTLAATASQALSNSTGVNIDDQMSAMLGLQNSYQASAKLLATINTMESALFTAVTPVVS